MKPKEFDELIRQKFDQNDFAYDSEHWDKLAEKLDGGRKKRNIIMWWWVPLAGMAASVALALGVTSLLRQQNPVNIGTTIARVQKAGTAQPSSAQPYADAASSAGMQQSQSAQNDILDNNTPVYAFAGKNSHSKKYMNKARRHKTGNDVEDNTEDLFGISLRNAITGNVSHHTKKIDLLAVDANAAPDKNKPQINGALETFKPQEDEKITKVPKLTISISGGYSHGSQNTGYMAGGNIRKMLNDKVYIESDVAFSSSTSVQATAYSEQVTTTNSAIGKHAAKEASSEGNKSSTYTSTKDVIMEKDISYDLYYAQVTPGIGYKLIKKMSIGVGPDFQRVLVDNRPATSTVDRNNIQIAPLFDVGFVGKTEYALTKKIKAAVYYRKGVNNLITPMDKYIDRDYLQFQVKYAIFNR